MGKTIRNAILLPSIFLNLICDLRKQKEFMKHQIAPLLNKAKSNNDGSLTEKDFLKINKYYGLAVPAILGEAFCRLRGKHMTNSERWVSTSQGIITGLFDDFFDDLKLPKDYIISMVEQPEAITPKSSNENLFLDFYLSALHKAAHPELIKRQLLLVHMAQVQSVEQENPAIDKKRIWEITKLKGGHSVLFYRTAFDNVPVAGEKAALYQLGSLMQYENDLFDIYKDAKGNIATMPTTSVKVLELRALYNIQIKLFIELCYKMDYPNNQVEQFLNKVMPVINRGFVCLDQYQQLEKRNGDEFDVASFSRKQLICDMEKLQNLFRTLRYQLMNHY